jgi:hypothetical protein
MLSFHRFAYGLTFVALVAWAPQAAHAAPIVAGDLIVAISQFCCGNPALQPDVFHLDSTGDFKGFFFSPFAPSDIAVDKSGRVLFGSSQSGTLIATDTSGAFLGFVTTPATSVDGLAVASNGDIVVADGNQLYHLSPQGQFIDLVFSPAVPSESLGIAPNGELVFPVASSQCCSNFSIGFFDLSTRELRTVPTPVRSIAALDVSEAGEIIVFGSTSTTSTSTTGFFRLGLDGSVLGQIAGPQNVNTIAVANLPEPCSALLTLAGLSILARLRRWRVRF